MKSFLIILFLFSQLISSAWGCGCDQPRSLEAMDGSWSFAFVDKVELVECSVEDGITTEIVLFDVIKNITDVKGGKARVLFRKGLTSCDLVEPNFKVGETFTLTMNRRIDVNLYYNNFCNLRLKH